MVYIQVSQLNTVYIVLPLLEFANLLLRISAQLGCCSVAISAPETS